MSQPALHPRVSVSGLCFPDAAADDAVRHAATLGASKTSMTSGKLREAGVDAVLDACRTVGVDVVATTGLLRFDLTTGADASEQLRRGREDIDLAAAVGATSVYTLTGPRVFDEWSDNANAYVNIVGELVEHAAARNITIAVEPTNWLYADLNFVHTFRDALALASQAGMKVCLDVFHVWTESELKQDIAKNIDLIAHVQLSDMARGARSLPCRAMPGEGDVPLRAFTRWVLDSGYNGPFDLELSGPDIDALGHDAAASKAACWLDSLLVDLGA